MSNDYPEHEKLGKVQDKSQAIGEFLDWLLNERHRLIGQFVPRDIFGNERFEHDTKSIQTWLSEYFSIDQTKLDREKRLMLEEMRQANKRRNP